MKNFLTRTAEIPVWVCLVVIACSLVEDIADRNWIAVALFAGGFLAILGMRVGQRSRQQQR